MLQFLTRTGNLTGVMPRLYVSCHPADFELHFRTLCSDIFAVQDNCAVFYEDEPGAAYDETELFALLSEMRLIVVPVTQRLLSERSRAIDVELPFAQKNNIAILPVLAEPDDSGELVTAFNSTEVFGGMQFLNRYDRDATALRYEDKLAAFLSSVLVSEEEVQRIHGEFSSKIFLSYRKKDREHAQDLMRRIHRVDICRDTAIWYDEYLVPGESFDANIKEALDESDVFVLSVSESFREEGNYVADHEYPDAVRKNKPRLAADMKHFDRASLDDLENMYPGINALMVDPDDADALGVSLRQRLTEDAGISEEMLLSDDGEHLFYIALAYKNGVRTEADPVRAAEIFRLSADNGCYESYLRLIKMYRMGDGIECSIEEALRLCDEAADILLPEAGSSMRNDNVLASVYTERGKIFSDRHEAEDAIEAFTMAYKIRRRMHQLFEDAPVAEFCESMMMLASAYFGLGSFEETKGLAEQFLSETGMLSEETGEAGDQASDAGTGFCEGSAVCPGAKAAAVIGSAGAEPDDETAVLRAKARVCSLMCALYIQLKQHSEVIRYARLRIDLLEKLEAATGSAADLKNLADAYLGYADFLKNRDLNEANAYIDKYSEIRRRLSEFESTGPRTISDAIDTFSIADNALLRVYSGDADAGARAEDLYNEVLEICSGLLDSSSRYNAIILTANVYKRFGDMDQAVNRSKMDALDHYKEALSVCRKAEKEFRNDLQLMHMTSGLLDQIGAICLGAGDLTGATQYYTDALETDMRASKVHDDPGSRHNLAKSYMRCASVNEERGHQPVADVNNKRALKILEPLVQQTDDYRIIEDLALAYMKLGMSARFTADQRLGYYRKAGETYLQLMAMTNNAAEYVNGYGSVLERIRALG